MAEGNAVFTLAFVIFVRCCEASGCAVVNERAGAYLQILAPTLRPWNTTQSVSYSFSFFVRTPLFLATTADL